MEASENRISIVTEPISIHDLRSIAESSFGDLVKAVVDIRRCVMAIGGDLHSDEEAALLDTGSEQHDLWGVNLYPHRHGGEDWLEFDSLINIRPSAGNRSRSVEDPVTRRALGEIVNALIGNG